MKCIAISDDCKFFLSGGHDKKIIIWSMDSFKKIGTLEDDGWVFSVVISEDCTFSISGNNLGKIKIWDIQT